MNEESAKATDLTSATLTPAAAAARSFDAHREHPLAEARAPQVGDEQAENDHDRRRRRSRERGSGCCRRDRATSVVRADAPPEQGRLLHRRAEAARRPTWSWRTRTARSRPRLRASPRPGSLRALAARTRRRRGRAPSPRATRRAAPRGSRCPRRRSGARRRSPQTPASATCASETWPTKPMMTTIDRQTTIPIRDSIRACR